MKTFNLDCVTHLRRIRMVAFWLSVTLSGASGLQAQQPPAFPAADAISIPPAPGISSQELPSVEGNSLSDEDGEVMLRGPVHEAYAEQFNANPVPGLLIQSKPPEPVEELPPDVRPEGRTVEWISGYWAWDEDQNDFMWVSGIWREVPQGFRWLPGYWAEVDGGFQWVSGTWVSTQTAEIEYHATAPPASLENGPAGVAPSAEHIWIPGCWSWQETRYAWRPGYWSVGYTNWIWVPARYCWTPRGYYFSNGYWDYPLERRGVLFAPYYFRRPVYVQRGFLFTPRIVVATNLLQFHLWVRPRYQHYYFGDYYNNSYAGRGLLPWHQYQRQYRGIDPLFTHYSRSRGGTAFYNQVNTQFNVFVNNPASRPAHTLRDQDRLSALRPNNDRNQPSLLGTQFQNVVEQSTRNTTGPRFVRLESDQKQRLHAESEQLRNLVSQRQRIEGSPSRRDGASPDMRSTIERPREGDGRSQPSVRNDSDRSDRLRLPPVDRRLETNSRDSKISGSQDGRRDGRNHGRTVNPSLSGDSGRGPSTEAISGRADAGRADAGRADAGRADAGRGDAGRGDAARGDAARGDAARGDAARGDAARGDAARGDAARGDAARGDAAGGDAARGDAGRGDAGWDDAARGAAARGDAGRGDAGRGDAGRGDAGRGDAGRGDAGRGDAGRGDAAPSSVGRNPPGRGQSVGGNTTRNPLGRGPSGSGQSNLRQPGETLSPRTGRPNMQPGDVGNGASGNPFSQGESSRSSIRPPTLASPENRGEKSGQPMVPSTGGRGTEINIPQMNQPPVDRSIRREPAGSGVRSGVPPATRSREQIQLPSAGNAPQVGRPAGPEHSGPAPRAFSRPGENLGGAERGAGGGPGFRNNIGSGARQPSSPRGSSGPERGGRPGR